MSRTALHDKHPTGKSPTCRGAPGDYQLTASGHPGKNSTAKLHHLLRTDTPVPETSPFIGINAEAKTRSAAIRTTMQAWMYSVKVDFRGEYWIDWLTLIFLAWIWQCTRIKGRIFAEIPRGTYLKYPYNAKKLTSALVEVVNRTFAPDVSVKILQYGQKQLTDIRSARDDCINVDTLPFTGMRAAQALAKVPDEFKTFVRSLITEHSLEMSIAIGVLHGSPPPPMLSDATRAKFSPVELESYEQGRATERRRLHNLGKLALTAPDEAILAAQRMQPTSHPVNPNKLVQPVARAWAHAGCLTPTREAQLAAAGSLNKKLTYVMGNILVESVKHGGIDMVKSDSRTNNAITGWTSFLKEVDPSYRMQIVTETSCMNRSTTLVIKALRQNKLNIIMLPTIFKTAAEFWKLMHASELRKAKREDAGFDVPAMWYDPDGLIPVKLDDSNGAVGIIVRATKTLTWSTLFHCWSGGYTSIVIAVQLSRAIVTNDMGGSPLALQLLGWAASETDFLYKKEQVVRKDWHPVRCMPNLAVSAVVQHIADQPQCADEDVRNKRLTEHGLVYGDARGAGYITRATIETVRGESAIASRKRTRKTVPLSFLDVIAGGVEATQDGGPLRKKARTAESDEPRVNLKRFISQPRGTRPKNYRWDAENGRYIRVLRQQTLMKK